MSISKRIKSKIENQTRDKSNSASKIKERFERLKEKEKQKSYLSGEFHYESNLYGFHNQLDEKLKQIYKGVELEKQFVGKKIKNTSGQCYAITDQIQVNIKCVNPNKVKEKYLSEFRIINGVGEYYESKLKKSGYKSVSDLLKHHRFCSPANEFIEIVNKSDGYMLFQRIEKRYPKSHHLVFLASSFFSLEDFIFIDIESLGLHGHPLFLIGIAYFENHCLQIEQILARDLDEEAAVLEYFKEKIQTKKVIGSYNGKSFDIPAIKYRMSYYRINHDFDHPHFDISHFSKNAFKGKFNNQQLITLESELFKVKRKDHIPSFLIPDYYRQYLSSKNIGTLVPIIEHNKQDIISTIRIFGKLHELWG